MIFSDCFSTGLLSPLNADSFAFRFTDFKIRASAGALSPSRRTIMSPGTNSEESISCSFPCLITVAFATAIFCRASIAFSALNSCWNPRKAFRIIIAIITVPSISSPIAKDIPAAAIRIQTRKLENWPRKIFIALNFFFFKILFSPYSRSLFFASSLPRPFSESEQSLSSASSFSSECHAFSL